MSTHMYREQGLYIWLFRGGGGFFNIYSKAFFINIDKQRIRLQIANYFCGGGKSIGGCYNLISGADSHRFKGQMETGGSGVHRQGVGGTDQLGELLFKRLGFSGGSQPAASQYF